MPDQQSAGSVAPATVKPRQHPLYHVVLLDDDDHTYEYVVEMLGELFGHSREVAYRMACEVDSSGRVIVDTAVVGGAEVKRGQNPAYGPDPRGERAAGSMSAVLERADN